MVTTGAVSNMLTVVPIGGTVAMGSFCILDTVLTIGGTATVGKTCVRGPAITGCMVAGTGLLKDVLLRPICAKDGDGAVAVAVVPPVCCACMP